MAKLSNGSRFVAVFVRFIRSDSPARDEDEMRRGEVRMQMEGKKEKKKGKGTVCLSRYGRVSRCTYYICFNLV